MQMPVVGFMLKVNGISSAIAIVAVSPGSAPTMMPPIEPRMIASRFGPLRTVAKPCTRRLKSSIGLSDPSIEPFDRRKRNLEGEIEDRMESARQQE